MIHKKTFVNAELNASYQLEYTHNLGTTSIIAKWYDENGVERMTSDLFQIVDDNNVILTTNEVLTGTHTLLLMYEAAGETTTGRRLFELSTTTDPSETLRLALGKASTPASNITLTAFLAWLLTKLGFLKVASNLSDLNNAATARANLSVYSTSQVDASLAAKASLYQSGSGGVLGVNNTSIYNPASNYNPATYRNVKNLGMKMLCAGFVSSSAGTATEYFRNSDVLAGPFAASNEAGSGHYRITHNKGNTSYYVFFIPVGATGVTIKPCMLTKTANYFDLYFADDVSGNDTDFEFFMFDLNAYTADE